MILQLFKVGIDNIDNANLLINAGVLYKDSFSDKFYITNNTKGFFLYLCDKKKISYSIKMEKIITYNRNIAYMLHKIIKNEGQKASKNYHVFNPQEIRYYEDNLTHIYIKDRKIIQLENYKDKPFKSFLVEEEGFSGEIKISNKGYSLRISPLITTKYFKEGLQDMLKYYLKIIFTNKNQSNFFEEAYDILKSNHDFNEPIENFKRNSIWICPRCHNQMQQKKEEDGFYLCNKCCTRSYIHDGKPQSTFDYIEVINRLTGLVRYYNNEKKLYGENKHLICIKGDYKNKEAIMEKDNYPRTSGIIFKDTNLPIPLDGEFRSSLWIEI